VSLSEILRSRDNLVDAEWAALGALAIRQQVFGLDHVQSAGAIEAVAEVRAAGDDGASARPLFMKAVALRLRSAVPGLKAADVIDRLLTLDSEDEAPGGAAAGTTDVIDAARRVALLETAADIRARILGVDAVATLDSLRRLASAMHATGDVARAEQIERRIAASESPAAVQ
jgi:hypothetical protein